MLDTEQRTEERVYEGPAGGGEPSTTDGGSNAFTDAIGGLRRSRLNERRGSNLFSIGEMTAGQHDAPREATNAGTFTTVIETPQQRPRLASIEGAHSLLPDLTSRGPRSEGQRRVSREGDANLMVDRDSTSLETGSKTRDPSGMTPSSHWQTSSAPPLLPLRRGSIGNPSATGLLVGSPLNVQPGRSDGRRGSIPNAFGVVAETPAALSPLASMRPSVSASRRGSSFQEYVSTLQADKRKQGEDDADTSTPRMRRKSVDLNSEQSADRMGTQNRRVSGLAGAAHRQSLRKASLRRSITSSSHSAAQLAMEHAQEGAASIIQRCWRGRKTRKSMEMWMGALKTLRESFMDERAKAAGASESSLYTDAALKARQALRTHPTVVEALNDAWTACRLAIGRPNATGLNKEEYLIMSRKIYLAGNLIDCDADISVEDVDEAAEEDWLADSEGADELNEKQLKDCWFQLADVHTESIDADEYAEWVRDVINTITTMANGDRLEEGAHEVGAWRTDSAMLEEIRQEAGVSKKDFYAINRSWCERFEPHSLKSSAVPRRSVPAAPEARDQVKDRSTTRQVSDTIQRESQSSIPTSRDGAGGEPKPGSAVGSRLDSKVGSKAASVAGSAGGSKIDSQTASRIGSKAASKPPSMVSSRNDSMRDANVGELQNAPETVTGSVPVPTPGSVPLRERRQVGEEAMLMPSTDPLRKRSEGPLNESRQNWAAEAQAMSDNELRAESSHGLIPPTGKPREGSLRPTSGSSISRMLNDAANTFLPGQLLRQTGAISQGSSPRSLSRPQSGRASRPLSARPSLSRPQSGRSRADSHSSGGHTSASRRPLSGKSRDSLSLEDWRRACGQSGGVEPSRRSSESANSSSTASFKGGVRQATVRLADATYPGLLSDPANRVRPTAAAFDRPWTRAMKQHLPVVWFRSQLVDLRAACSRLVGDVSDLAVQISRDSDWPCVDIDVHYGTHDLSLSMTVLQGSPAISMNPVELGARLMTFIRDGIYEEDLLLIAASIAYPVQ